MEQYPHLKEFKRIFQKVYSAFKYMTDEEQYGEVDKWVCPVPMPQIIGDCEDFALYARKLCREAGIPTRLVFCLTENGGGHCFLEHQGFVMDNRFNRTTTRNKLLKKGYRFIAISGYEKGDPWHVMASE